MVDWIAEKSAKTTETYLPACVCVCPWQRLNITVAISACIAFPHSQDVKIQKKKKLHMVSVGRTRVRIVDSGSASFSRRGHEVKATVNYFRSGGGTRQPELAKKWRRPLADRRSGCYKLMLATFLPQMPIVA